MSDRLLKVETSCLLVVDIQEKFVPIIHEYDRVVERARVMLEGAGLLGVPVIVSEQYPKGLGKTVPDLVEAFPEKAEVHDKTAFGCLGDGAIRERVESLGRKQVIVCGIETHICVNQTVHQLLEAGFEVHLIEDALGSRAPENREIGLAKMRASGAISSCAEMALFELMGGAKHPNFKEVQALIK
jgi:nicotinamidase-related amidase